MGNSPVWTDLVSLLCSIKTKTLHPTEQDLLEWALYWGFLLVSEPIRTFHLKKLWLYKKMRKPLKQHFKKSCCKIWSTLEVSLGISLRKLSWGKKNLTFSELFISDGGFQHSLLCNQRAELMLDSHFTNFLIHKSFSLLTQFLKK